MDENETKILFENSDVSDEEIEFDSTENSWPVNEVVCLKWLFCWLQPILLRGLCRKPRMKDLPKLPVYHHIEKYEDSFDFMWKIFTKLRLPFKLIFTLFWCFKWMYCWAFVLQGTSCLLLVFLPKVVEAFLNALLKKRMTPSLEYKVDEIYRHVIPRDDSQYPDPSHKMFRTETHNGWIWLGVLIFMYCLSSWLSVYARYVACCVAMKMKSLLISKIYQKSFRLSNKGKLTADQGLILNCVTDDCRNAEFTIQNLPYALCSALQIVGSFIFLAMMVGYGALAGFAVVILLIPFVLVAFTIFTCLRKCLMAKTDMRMSKLMETLQGLRVIKFFAWEKSYLKRIKKIRRKEIRFLFAMHNIFSFTYSTMLTMTSIVALVTFLVYYFTNDLYLDFIIVFSCLTYINLMKIPLSQVPVIFVESIIATIAFSRCERVLKVEERVEQRRYSDYETPIVVRNGNFEWVVQKKEENVGKLRDINFEIRKGNLVVVCGVVGSGKSSLIHALIGNMDPKDELNEVRISGKVGYFAQEPWMQNATLEENILFGNPYEENKFNTIIDVCSLEEDLRILDGGKKIWIGEKGVNISGGQKARIQLARLCYSDCDVLLLDDPLAALDSMTGKSIFEKCVCGYLKNRTRIFVTHRLDLLSRADYIIMMEEGSIIEQGSYEELIERNGKTFEMMNEYIIGKKNQENTELEMLEAEKTSVEIDIISSDSEPEKEEEEGENCNDEKSPLIVVTSPEIDSKSSSEEIDIPKKKFEEEEEEEKENILKEEEQGEGMIGPLLVWRYIRGMDGSCCDACCCWKLTCFAGIFPCLLLLCMYIFAQICLSTSNWWLAAWSSGTFTERYGNERAFFFGVNWTTHAFLPFDPALADDDNITPIKPTDNMFCADFCSLHRDPYEIVKFGEVQATFCHLANISECPPPWYQCPYDNNGDGCYRMKIPMSWDPKFHNDEVEKDGISQMDSVYIYAALSVLAIILASIRDLCINGWLLRSAEYLHENALRRIIAAPMSFFDQTPIGRILTRFSTDQRLVDVQIILSISVILALGLQCLGMFTLVCITSNGWLVLAVLLLFFSYSIVYCLSRRPSIELKRICSVSFSPVVAQISESFAGMSTISVLRAKKRFLNLLHEKLNYNNKSVFVWTASQSWVVLYISFCGHFYTLVVCAFFLNMFYYHNGIKELNESLVSLSVSLSIAATQSMFLVFQNLNLTEGFFNSVERIDHYLRNVDSEIKVKDEVEEKKNLYGRSFRRKTEKTAPPPPSNWPSNGVVEYEDYSMSYRTELPLVLKNLTFKINKNEKIGIVGRTGSGKSSLILTLFRMTDFS